MENNANEAHIFWKSPDQQTEVWMKQVSGKTPEEKKEQSRSGYRLLAEMIKTRFGLYVCGVYSDRRNYSTQCCGI